MRSVDEIQKEINDNIARHNALCEEIELAKSTLSSEVYFIYRDAILKGFGYFSHSYNGKDHWMVMSNGQQFYREWGNEVNNSPEALHEGIRSKLTEDILEKQSYYKEEAEKFIRILDEYRKNNPKMLNYLKDLFFKKTSIASMPQKVNLSIVCEEFLKSEHDEIISFSKLPESRYKLIHSGCPCLKGSHSEKILDNHKIKVFNKPQYTEIRLHDLPEFEYMDYHINITYGICDQCWNCYYNYDYHKSNI